LLSRETNHNKVFDWGQIGQFSNRVAKHDQEIKSLSISPDQRFVAAVGDDALVSITEIDSRQRVGEFSTLREELNLSRPQEVAVDFDPSVGSFTLAAIARYEVVIWAGPNEPLRKLRPNSQDEGASLRSLQYSPDGEVLVAGDAVGTLWIWDTKTWKVQKWGYCDGSIDDITFHPDGRMAISHASSAKKETRISCLDLVNREVIFGPINSRSSNTVDLDFCPVGDTLASSSRSSVAHLWNAKTGEHFQSVDTGSLRVLSVGFEPSGQYLATGTGSVVLWEMQDMVETIALDIELVPIYAIEFARDGSFLLSGGHDNTVRIWRAPLIKR
jgi:WD40 repeat protein